MPLKTLARYINVIYVQRVADAGAGKRDKKNLTMTAGEEKDILSIRALKIHSITGGFT
jgi:hypothetical protein